MGSAPALNPALFVSSSANKQLHTPLDCSPLARPVSCALDYSGCAVLRLSRLPFPKATRPLMSFSTVSHWALFAQWSNAHHRNHDDDCIDNNMH